MKISLFAALLLCAALLGSQCKHPKYTAQNLPEERLIFGGGGGFTGLETAYTLLENGQVFKFTSKAPEPMEMPAVKKKAAKKLFERAEALGLLDMDFTYPGNMYRFVEFQDDGRSRRVSWGDTEHPVDSTVQALHDALMQLVAPPPAPQN